MDHSPLHLQPSNFILLQDRQPSSVSMSSHAEFTFLRLRFLPVDASSLADAGVADDLHSGVRLR